MKLATLLCLNLSLLFSGVSGSYACEKEIDLGELVNSIRNGETPREVLKDRRRSLIKTTPQLERKEAIKMQLGLYEHYKGNKYRVIGISRHSETLEELVVYQALYGDYGLWVRPLAMFQEKVLFQGHEVPRFRFLQPLFETTPQLR